MGDAVPTQAAELPGSCGPCDPAGRFEGWIEVFYPFFTTRARGSGLGLPSAQKIAAAHGGGIEIESRPGACTLGMRLPVEEGP